MNYEIGAAQGWQCPICGSIWAPFIPQCLNCNDKKSHKTTTSTSTYTYSTSDNKDTYSSYLDLLHIKKDDDE